MKRLSAGVAGIALLCAVPVFAHHSFSAEFDHGTSVKFANGRNFFLGAPADGPGAKQ